MENNLKERLKNGEMVFGSWSSIPSPALLNAIGCSGVDFMIIDAEHGPVNMEKAEDLIRAAEVTGTTPIIRIPSREAHLILRALDIGAHGIEVPHVSTKEEAQAVVKHAKYYPQGERGYSPLTRAGKYGLEAQDHARKSNEKTMVIVHIEGTEGLKNLKQIVDVEGIDVVFLGPYDLSQSLGKPGQIKDPEVIEHIQRGVEVIRKRGLACGSFAQDLEFLQVLIDCGVQYLTYSVDATVVLNSYKELYQAFQERKRVFSDV